jgi:hypothetical protein
MRFEGEDVDQIEVDEDPELQRAVENVESARWLVDKAKDQLSEHRARLLKILAARGTKSVYVSIEGEVYKATAVAGERAKVDEEALLHLLSQDQIEAVTTRKVNVRLLTEAVATGRVDAELVAEHTTLVPIESYPKITKVDGGKQE